MVWILVRFLPVSAFSFLSDTRYEYRSTATALHTTATGTPIASTSRTDHHHHHHHRNIIVLSHNVSDNVAGGFFDINDLLQGRVDVLARCVNAALWVSNGIRTDTSIFLMLFPQNVTMEIQGAHVKGLNPNERTMALYLQKTLLLIDNNTSAGTNSSSSTATTTPNSQRREKEVERLQQRTLERPITINPHKPGGVPKSEKKRHRDARKIREAAVRRIQKASAAAGSSIDGEYGAPPPGFILHRHDTLQSRLDYFSTTGTILMLNEGAASLGEALREIDSASKEEGIPNNDQGDTATTFILGNQLGYTAGDEKLLTEHDMVRQVSLGPRSLLTSQCITITHHYLDCSQQDAKHSPVNTTW
jgi:tRNA pseudouridine-54 N-methylase